MPQDEVWSWKKLAKGIFVGKNYAKALVMMFCMAIILTIVLSVGSVIRSRFSKPPQPTVGTNSGVVLTSTEDRSGNTFSLFNLFNFK